MRRFGSPTKGMIVILLLCFFFVPYSEGRMQLTNYHKQVVMDNGLVQVTLSKPAGHLTGIKYKGCDNVLETLNGNSNRGYWDVVWKRPGRGINYDRLKGEKFNVIKADREQVEVSFTKVWNMKTDNSTVPLNVDKRFILRRGSSGLYAYAILERLQGWPDVDIDQIRIALKLKSNKFQMMMLSKDIKRIMPTRQDRSSGRRLAYPEAVILTHPTNPQFRGEVDDKYQYSLENAESKVQGWISNDPVIGLWMITPSDEFKAGGPIKQDLTSHAGPTVLSMFTSTHYAGKDLNTQYRNGEPWKKVLGPVYVYLNSLEDKNSNDSLYLWKDANKQMSKEVQKWPYDFPVSKDLLSGQRGTVSGRLLVHDKYANRRLSPASDAYVGLAAPGELGSWQIEAKGYQFWSRANGDGQFFIKNIRPGDYNLYAWVPGVIGDYKYDFIVTIKPGRHIKLGELKYEPPRNGPTLWEIGVPDRKSTEFYVPEADPTLVNKLYKNLPQDKFRQYGLWDRYTDLYPKHDLTYTIGISDHRRDWFFAHVLRKTGKRTYEATTWRIIFKLQHPDYQTGNYTLQIALASATAAELQVTFNNQAATRPYFSTGLIGKDNAIARHGNHGLYRLYSIQVPREFLKSGTNTIYLTQARGGTPFRGIMYDYIRLEGPPPTNYIHLGYDKNNVEYMDNAQSS